MTDGRSSPNEPAVRSVSIREAVLLAVWFGLLAGLLDAGALQFRRLLIEPIVFTSPHVPWTAPLFDAILFLFLGTAAWGVGRLLPSGWHRSLLVWGYTSLGVMGALYHFPSIHRGAALLIAVGIGVQLARVMGRHGKAFERLIRRSLPAVVTLAVALAATQLGRRALTERRALGQLPVAARGAPNVLLIVLDTVRALNLSLYGYHRETTPGLERWARSGVRFDRAIATASWTLPSHASLMTGRYAHEMTANWMQPLDGRDSTLAEVLGAAGWVTAGFVANTDYASAEVGLARGFSHYEDYTLSPGQIAMSSALGRAISRIRPLRRLVGSQDNLGRKTAPDIGAAFLNWVDGHPGRPFFAFLNYYDAHRPYLPPEPFASRFQTPGIPLHPRIIKENGADPQPPAARVQGAIDAYDGAISYLDAQIVQLLDSLSRRGLLNNTIVILTSDHGEEFLEHGLWDHGNSLYLPSVHVPLVVSWPGHVAAGRVVLEPVSLRDVPATVISVTRGTASPFPGASLLRFVDRTAPEDTVLSDVRRVERQPERYPASAGDLTSVVAGPWHYIRNLGTKREELYQIESDPMEQSDLSGTTEHRLIVERMRDVTGHLAR